MLIQSIWELFLSLISPHEDNGEPEESSRFVPSPLDLSVRVGHGGPDDQVERELSKITEQAREIEEKQDHN